MSKSRLLRDLDTLIGTPPTPGWYVARGVSHYFREGSASLCGRATHTPTCERRRAVYANATHSQHIEPEAEPCKECRKLHVRMWAGR